MSEQEAAPAAPVAPAEFEPKNEDRDYRGLLEDLAGKKVTVVNPESFEARPREGHELREAYYPGKITGFGQDYIIFQTVLVASKKDRQPVQQFIPLARIKRVSVLRGATLLHL